MSKVGKKCLTMLVNPSGTEGSANEASDGMIVELVQFHSDG